MNSAGTSSSTPKVPSVMQTSRTPRDLPSTVVIRDQYQQLKGSRRKALPLGALANALAAGEPEACEVIETAMVALVEKARHTGHSGQS